VAGAGGARQASAGCQPEQIFKPLLLGLKIASKTLHVPYAATRPESLGCRFSHSKTVTLRLGTGSFESIWVSGAPVSISL
jgi:hypothetical protein